MSEAQSPQPLAAPAPARKLGLLAVLVLVFATGMGAVSGIYPAQRAVLLNPVTALKYE